MNTGTHRPASPERGKFASSEVKFSNFSWIDIQNPSREELLALTENHNLEMNMLKDSLQDGHLPKIEITPEYTFIILRAYSAGKNDIVTTVSELSDKIAFFISEKTLITIHRASFAFLKDNFNRELCPEGLALSIISRMLHTYQEPVSYQSDIMDSFEKEIFLRNSKPISTEELYYQKSKARISKKVLQLTQNVLNQFTVQPHNLTHLQDLRETTQHYLLFYDEVIEDANNILNTYLSITAKKSNDVMKVLTIFSAFFLPLTFIAGIYGMNFKRMPELGWHNGYFMTLGVMVLISFIIFLWFRRKRFF